MITEFLPIVRSEGLVVCSELLATSSASKCHGVTAYNLCQQALTCQPHSILLWATSLSASFFSVLTAGAGAKSWRLKAGTLHETQHGGWGGCCFFCVYDYYYSLVLLPLCHYLGPSLTLCCTKTTPAILDRIKRNN